MGEGIQALDQITGAALDMGLKVGPKILVAGIILFAGYLAGRWAARATARGLRTLQLEPPVRQLIERAVRLVVFALFLIIALQNLGVELLPLVAGLGVAGAGVALAMQGVLGNVVAGLTIIFSRPFRVGDYISIVNEEGVVLDVNIFTTTLGHADLSQVVIPNRKIVGEILHNYGKIRQLSLEVGVSYATDIAVALDTVNGVLRDNARVLKDPAPAVKVTKLADSSVTIGVLPWVNVPDYAAAVGEVNRAILEAFRARRIDIPFPQREIRVISADAGVRQSPATRLPGRDAA